MTWRAIGLASPLVLFACQRDTASTDEASRRAEQQAQFTPSPTPLRPFDEATPLQQRGPAADRRRVPDLRDPFSRNVPARSSRLQPDLKDPFAGPSSSTVERPSVTLRDPFSGETVEQPAPRRRASVHAGRAPDLKDPFRGPPKRKRSARQSPPLKDPFAK
jgi:hypothetical protein